MKQYTQPIIKKVILDPVQAVLQVCKVGGQYFMTGSTGCMSIGGKLGPQPLCYISVKGYIRSIQANTIENEAMPS
ncbi:MAG: hypothetical protein PHQ52_08340 [Candidatus Omnitrophica bacterium]|nr:hypothetical protein [Candidatus Omnitrophota bacterium]